MTQSSERKPTIFALYQENQSRKKSSLKRKKTRTGIIFVLSRQSQKNEKI